MFPRVGAHGDSESSKKNNRNSLSRFNMFLHAKGMKEFSDLEPQELNIELFKNSRGIYVKQLRKLMEHHVERIMQSMFTMWRLRHLQIHLCEFIHDCWTHC